MIAVALDGMQRADGFGSPMAGLRGAIETLDLEHTKVWSECNLRVNTRRSQGI